ncbi:hypothetical protein G9A89_003692 [Geosiphon pyriformis]|nr:hypothetical protein G9A89_003692 [Geosiphon pyriformis]
MIRRWSPSTCMDGDRIQQRSYEDANESTDKNMGMRLMGMMPRHNEMMSLSSPEKPLKPITFKQTEHILSFAYRLTLFFIFGPFRADLFWSLYKLRHHYLLAAVILRVNRKLTWKKYLRDDGQRHYRDSYNENEDIFSGLSHDIMLKILCLLNERDIFSVALWDIIFMLRFGDEENGKGQSFKSSDDEEQEEQEDDEDEEEEEQGQEDVRNRPEKDPKEDR